MKFGIHIYIITYADVFPQKCPSYFALICGVGSINAHPTCTLHTCPLYSLRPDAGRGGQQAVLGQPHQDTQGLLLPAVQHQQVRGNPVPGAGLQRPFLHHHLPQDGLLLQLHQDHARRPAGKEACEGPQDRYAACVGPAGVRSLFEEWWVWEEFEDGLDKRGSGGGGGWIVLIFLRRQNRVGEVCLTGWFIAGCMSVLLFHSAVLKNQAW